MLGSVTAVDPIVANALMMGMPYEALASSKDPKKAGNAAPQSPSALQPHAAISTALGAASTASQPHTKLQHDFSYSKNGNKKCKNKSAHHRSIISQTTFNCIHAMNTNIRTSQLFLCMHK